MTVHEPTPEIKITPVHEPTYVTIHPDNLAEFAEHLESLGVYLAVDLDQHRRLWAEQHQATATSDREGPA